MRAQTLTAMWKIHFLKRCIHSPVFFADKFLHFYVKQKSKMLILEISRYCLTVQGKVCTWEEDDKREERGSKVKRKGCVDEARLHILLKEDKLGFI